MRSRDFGVSRPPLVENPYFQPRETPSAPIPPPPGEDVLLLTDGSYFLLTNNSYLFLAGEG